MECDGVQFPAPDFLEGLEAARQSAGATPEDSLGISCRGCDNDKLVPLLGDGVVILQCNKCGGEVKRIAILDFAGPAEELEGCNHTQAAKSGYLNGSLHLVCPCCGGLVISIPVRPRRIS